MTDHNLEQTDGSGTQGREAPIDPRKLTMTNKQQLRSEIEAIERQLQNKVKRAGDRLKATAEADRRDIERAEQKLASIKEVVKGGWNNVTEAAAAALLRLLK